MSRCVSSRILTNPGMPPLGEASHQPSRLLVAITIKGDWRMKALTGSGKTSLTLLATLSVGWPNCWVNGLSKLGSKVAMRYASCRAGARSCGAGIQGNQAGVILNVGCIGCQRHAACTTPRRWALVMRSEEHTSELQSLRHIVCAL